MIPTLETSRLRLQPFRLEHAADVQRYAGDYDVAKMTTNIPHPYEDGMAEEWIGGHAEQYAKLASVTWAVELRADGGLVGAAALKLEPESEAGEIGYWIGKPFWGRGYATEAALAVVGFGFDELRLHRICARHYVENPASGRVMQKAGMQYEGTLRHTHRRFGEWHDFCHYSILEPEYRE